MARGAVALVEAQSIPTVGMVEPGAVTPQAVAVQVEIVLAVMRL
tara:strand:- start:346 stop:477 length:132 start_codon:yes stop_codon:yes gene_type:complete